MNDTSVCDINGQQWHASIFLEIQTSLNRAYHPHIFQWMRVSSPNAAFSISQVSFVILPGFK